MKKLALIVAGLLLITMTTSFAEDKKLTKEDVKVFVEKAVDFYKKNGEVKAIEAFNAKEGDFRKGELYVFAVDLTGKTLAHSNAKLIGMNVSNLKDSSGKPFIQEMIALAKDKGAGWIEYTWTHPETKKVKPKISYLVKVSPTLFISAGIYKDAE